MRLLQVVRALVNFVAAFYRATVLASANHYRRRHALPPLDRHGRRLLAATTGFFTFVILVAITTSNTAPAPSTSTNTAARSTSTYSAPAPTYSAPTASTPTATRTPVQDDPNSELSTIARVIDGDTFVLSDDRRVRVLGIDSCEMNTPGGRDAKTLASVFVGGAVTLTIEPGVDVDQYGRLLRYVDTSAGDFGVYMVKHDHTGVYDPANNDASQSYLDLLYSHDRDMSFLPAPAGRDCSKGSSAPQPNPDRVDVGNDDDDDDGGESRFCRGRIWC